jgi:hypothetical protein
LLSRTDAITLLNAVCDPRFAEAAGLLKAALEAGAKFGFSGREVPTRELRNIWLMRRDHCRHLGLEVLGLEGLAEALAASECDTLRIATIAGTHSGGIFLDPLGRFVGCVVSGSTEPE